MEEEVQVQTESRVVVNIPFPLLFIFWYFCTSILALFEYSLWVRFQEDDIISVDGRNSYLVFGIIGMAAYMGVAAPSFFRAYKYSTTVEQRENQLKLGMTVMYFAEVLPLFCIDLWLVYEHGVLYVLQGIMFVLFLISWWFGSFAVWFVYMSVVAKYLHIKTGTDRMAMFAARRHETVPPTIYSKPLPGQPDIV